MSRNKQIESGKESLGLWGGQWSALHHHILKNFGDFP